MRAQYDNYSHYKAADPRNKRKMGIVDYIMATLTIIVCILLGTSYLAPFVSPDIFWPLALLGLSYQIMYIVCAMLLLYWVIRWRRLMLLPLMVLVLGSGYLSRIAKPELGKNYMPATDRNSIKVLTYNVKGLIGFGPNKKDFSTARDVMMLAEELKPDIICFQEFQTTPHADKNFIGDLLNWLPHCKFNYKLQNQNDNGWGTAIYSRFPIINSGAIDFSESTNSAQWVDVVVKRDTIRLFNAHLQSFLLTASDKEFINQDLMLGDAEQKIRNIVGKLKRGYRSRAMQADTLSGIVRQSPYQTLVCGDFNDTPVSYVYNTIKGDLHDAFVEKGRGMVSNTYRGFFNLFRIDYILHSSGYETLSYEILDSPLSDHNPVVVTLKRQ